MLTPARYGRNAIYHSIDGICFFAAIVLVSTQVVVPKIVMALTGSKFVLSLVPVVITLGILVPQILHAKSTEGRPRYRSMVLFYGAFERMGWLLFLISLQFWWQSPHTLVVLFGVLLLNSLAVGFRVVCPHGA